MTSVKNDLINDPVKSLLIKMTLPMIMGMFGIVAFNMVDTFYVSRLGITPLAAMTLTFPVVLVVNALALGIGIGASAIISKAAGEKNQHKVVRYTTDSLVLGLLLVFIFVVVGLLTIKPLFTLLGADQQTMPFVLDYMRIWYLGVIFVVVPMIGNSGIRALGDTKTPATIMAVAAGVNIILDPIFIFGWGPVPPMGIKGAAIATILSRAITLSVSLYVLIYRQKIVSFKRAKMAEVLESFKLLLFIGIPNALSKVMVPIAMGFITRLIAGYGKEAIAGFGIATRIEMFAMLILGALATISIPLLGQNIGAHQAQRVTDIIKNCEWFSVVYGVGIALLMFFTGESIASIFTPNAEVVSTASFYLKIVPISFGIQGLFLIYSGILNVLNRPVLSSAFSILRLFALYVPLALIGSHYFGLMGVWIALILSFVLATAALKLAVKSALLKSML